MTEKEKIKLALSEIKNEGVGRKFNGILFPESLVGIGKEEHNGESFYYLVNANNEIILPFKNLSMANEYLKDFNLKLNP